MARRSDSDDLETKIARALFAAEGTDADWKWEPSRWDRRHPDEDARYRNLARVAISLLVVAGGFHHGWSACLNMLKQCSADVGMAAEWGELMRKIEQMQKDRSQE